MPLSPASKAGPLPPYSFLAWFISAEVLTTHHTHKFYCPKVFLFLGGVVQSPLGLWAAALSAAWTLEVGQVCIQRPPHYPWDQPALQPNSQEVSTEPVPGSAVGESILFTKRWLRPGVGQAESRTEGHESPGFLIYGCPEPLQAVHTFN